MSIIFVLIPVSLVLVGIGVWAFFWAVRTGQFDELDSAAWEILLDDPADAAAPAAQPTSHHKP
jgi:cbb3-type cytochrome oxidase maturation protein